MKLSKYQQDVAERVLWTTAQAAVAVFAVHAGDLPVEWAIPFAAILATLKSLIAKRIGANDAALPLWVSTGITEVTTDVVEKVANKARVKKQ